MNASDWHTIWFTLWVSAAGVVLILPLALAMAWLLARKHWRGKSVVEAFFSLPLVLPPVATGLILLKLFGRRGMIGAWLEGMGVEVVFTWKAVAIALGVMSFPLLQRSLRTAFEEVPLRLEQVARTLGASPWQVFWTITLPLARRGVAAGVVLAFARALGEFGATMILAGYIPGKTGTLALEMYHAIQLGEDERAMQLLVMAFIISFVALWLGECLNKRKSLGK